MQRVCALEAALYVLYPRRNDVVVVETSHTEDGGGGGSPLSAAIRPSSHMTKDIGGKERGCDIHQIGP